MNLFGLWWAWLTIGSGLGIFLTYLKLSKENENLKEFIKMEDESRRSEVEKFRDDLKELLDRNKKLEEMTVTQQQLVLHLKNMLFKNYEFIKSIQDSIYTKSGNLKKSPTLKKQQINDIESFVSTFEANEWDKTWNFSAKKEDK